MANALFPKRIELDNASIQQLQQLFDSATNDLKSYIVTLNGHAINRAQIMAIRQQAQARLQQLGNDVGAWVAANVPEAYVSGQQDAARQQSSFGNKMAAGLILGSIAGGMYAKYASNKVMTTAKIIAPSTQTFNLQNQAIENIVKDMSASFGNTLTYMSRSTDGIISRVQALGLRQAIAEGARNGTDVADISKTVSNLIQNSGIYGLIDKSGRQWSPDVYADMLVQTKLTEARNNGMMNSLLSVGQDLVEVSYHAATDVCADWEGQILSITGRSKLYPSVQDATNGGLFHPRCKHTLNAVPPDSYPDQYLNSNSTLMPEMATV